MERLPTSFIFVNQQAESRDKGQLSAIQERSFDESRLNDSSIKDISVGPKLDNDTQPLRVGQFSVDEILNQTVKKNKQLAHIEEEQNDSASPLNKKPQNEDEKEEGDLV